MSDIETSREARPSDPRVRARERAVLYQIMKATAKQVQAEKAQRARTVLLPHEALVIAEPRSQHEKQRRTPGAEPTLATPIIWTP